MIHVLRLALLAFGLGCTSTYAQSFSDDFNRLDSTAVGNGWIASPNDSPGSLVVQSGALANPHPLGAGTVYRPFDFSSDGRIRLTFTETNGFNGPHRFENAISLFSDGIQDGVGLHVFFTRSDQGFENSQVDVRINGTIIETQFSTFQYGSRIDVDFAYTLSGQVYGSVTGAGFAPFDFSFSSLSLPSGTNLGIRLAGGVSMTGTADNFSVTPIPEPATYAMLLAGLGALGIVARRRRINGLATSA